MTRNRDYRFEGAKVVDSIRSALMAADEDAQPFVAGGAEIYVLAMDYIHTIYLTRVHAEVEGDAFLPEIEWDQWELQTSERHDADEKNDHDYSFEIYRRR